MTVMGLSGKATMDVNESSPVRGEKVQDGRVVINQVDGTITIYDVNDNPLTVLGAGFINMYDTSGDKVIDIIDGNLSVYDEDGNIVVKHGYLGTISGERLYGTAIYDDLGVMFIREGYIGKDGSGNKMYGRMLNDGTNDRDFQGKQTNGFN